MRATFFVDRGLLVSVLSSDAMGTGSKTVAFKLAGCGFFDKVSSATVGVASVEVFDTMGKCSLAPGMSFAFETLVDGELFCVV